MNIVNDEYRYAKDSFDRGDIANSLTSMRRIAELLADFYIQKFDLVDDFNKCKKSNPNLGSKVYLFRKRFGHLQKNKFAKRLLCFLDQAHEYGNKGAHSNITKDIQNDKYKAQYLISYYEEYIQDGYNKDYMESIIVDVTKEFDNHRIHISSCVNNQYLSARTDADCALQGNIENADSWETFFVTVDNDGWASFECHNKLYLTVEDDESRLYATAKEADYWEKFKIYRIEDKYCIKAKKNKKWLSCYIDSDDKQIQASINVVDAWETFKIEIIG